MDSLLEPITKDVKEQFCIEMMKRLDIQRRNEHSCDVILEVGSGDEQARLKVHRIVLCAAGPFFYNALKNTDMKEKKEGLIRLKETNKAVMEEVLEYLYTGNVGVTQHNAYELFAQADYFLLPSLKALCGEVILESLSLSNCVMNFYFAVKYQWEELQKAARDFILANFVTVAETEDFLNLSSTQILEWFSSDEIIVRGEEDVFEALIKWIDKEESRYESFSDLFHCVRCIYLPRDYLVNVILNNSFVKGNLDCSSLAFNAMKMVFSGNEDFYFAQPPRNCLKTHEDAIVVCGEKRSMLCYIPSVDKWYKLADLLSNRCSYEIAMSVCQGKVYVVGGDKRRGSYPAERYDPSSNTWSPLKSFKQDVTCTAVVKFQGLLYVLGGEDKDDNKLKTVLRFSPGANLWQEAAPMSIARAAVCAVADTNLLYAIGGRSDDGEVNIVERFDPKEKTWNRVASTVVVRGRASGAVVNKKIFVFGGTSHREQFPVEIYDPAVDTWSVVANVVGPIGTLMSATSFKGKIFVCGYFGQDFSDGRSLQIFDPDRNEWKCCNNNSLCWGDYFISCLRMPIEVLDSCEVVSETFLLKQGPLQKFIN